MKKQLIPVICFFLLLDKESSSQNIGIGTPTPAFKLDVQGRMRVKAGTPGNVNTSSGIWFDDYRNGNNQFFFGMKDSIRGGFYGSGTGIGWDLVFNTRTGIFGDRFSLNGSFNMHSGVTNHLSGSIYSDSNDLYIESRRGATMGSRGNLIFQYSDFQNPDAPGNVGIGTNDPAQKLDVSGNIRASGEILRTATGNANMVPICYGTVDANGTILTGSGNFTVYPVVGLIGYRINVLGLDLSTSNSVVTVTVATFSWLPLIAQVGDAGGLFNTGCGGEPCDFNVFFINAGNLELTTTKFSFIIFKP